MAATDADVVLIETSGAFCTQAMAELEKNTVVEPDRHHVGARAAR